MFVAYLWPEYQYPHDMVWRLVFRITAVAAALLIAPFLTDQSVQRAVGYWGLLGLLALPLLGLVVLGGGFFMPGRSYAALMRYGTPTAKCRAES